MECTARIERSVTVIEIKGRLDAASAPEFEKHCLKACSEAKSGIVLDLAQLAFLGSAGLRALLILVKAGRSANKKVVLCNPTAVILDVLKLAGFAEIIPTFTSLEQAITGAG